MIDAREDYDRYYYLWHLIAIGALDANPPPESCSECCPEIHGVIWDSNVLERDSAKIALIDMGVARFHPNLEPQPGGADPQQSRVVWDEALDLASHRFGAKYVAMNQRHLEDRATHLDNILADANLVARIGATVSEQSILDGLAEGCGVNRYVDSYNQSYANHGTCCAGLVCGTSFSDDQVGNQGNPIVYYGVDPYSRIVPITTSISPDPEQLIAAFLYAHSLDVDVILFPRDVADTYKMPHYAELDINEKTRLHRPGDANAPDDNPPSLAWELLERVIVAVSEDIPVVCAAGNDGRSELIYPASLASDAGNGVIAVGAVSYKGYRSGYSNYGAGLTVVAPSDDGEVYNRHQIRLDRRALDAVDLWIEGGNAPNNQQVHQCPNVPKIDFSAERLVALDTPGPRGYAAGGREGPILDRLEAVDDPNGLYTEFGGTSGAAALVAGVVALMQRKKPGRLTGPVVKGLLEAPVATNVDISHWYWIQGGRDELGVDAMNGEAPPNVVALFGDGGLVDVPTLLALVP